MTTYLNGSEIISTAEKEDLFDDEEEDKELDDSITDFRPPFIVKNETNLLDATPVIKFKTPIRKKESPTSFINIPKINNSPVRKLLQTPKPDYSDEDDVNERVNFLINNPNEVTYDEEHENIQETAADAFEIKFKNLSLNYPDYKIKFPEGKSLNKIHKSYHDIIKSIYVNMNLGQTQLGYVLCLMVLEFICVKAFGLPMSGFTNSELKRMYKHNSMMIELGELMYSTSYGGTPSSLEWRLLSGVFWNVIVFLGVKILTNYVGGEDMSELIRGLIDKLTDNPISRTNIESGEAKDLNDADGVSGILDDLFTGDGSNELASIIANFGTSFTEKIERNNNKGGNTKKKNKRRFIFNS